MQRCVGCSCRLRTISCPCSYPGVFCTQKALNPLVSEAAWRDLPHHLSSCATAHTLRLVIIVPRHMLAVVGWCRPEYVGYLQHEVQGTKLQDNKMLILVLLHV